MLFITMRKVDIRMGPTVGHDSMGLMGHDSVDPMVGDGGMGPMVGHDGPMVGQ